MNIRPIRMLENDADANTVGEYLSCLLAELWEQEDGFSGKRPFGNSGWKDDVYMALVASGAVMGSIDEDGWLIDVDTAAADQLVKNTIRAMGGSL